MSEMEFWVTVYLMAYEKWGDEQWAKEQADGAWASYDEQLRRCREAGGA
jgi:hypothetical protein